MSSLTIPIPDCRFESTFRRSLHGYSKPKKAKRKDNILIEQEPQPLPQITPGIVVYAIIKDQIVMQFVQGFGMALFYMGLRMYSVYVMRSGYKFGVTFRRWARSLGKLLGSRK